MSTRPRRYPGAQWRAGRARHRGLFNQPCSNPDRDRERSDDTCLVAFLDGYTVSVYRNLMIQSFADATTADLWEERNSKAARRVPRGIWPTVHRKLTMLDSAQRLDDLAAVPGNRLEALAGDRKGSTAFE